MTRPGRAPCLFILLAALGRVDAAHVTVNEDNVLVIGGTKVFPIGFTMPPPPNRRT